jgi:hypothetical protein
VLNPCRDESLYFMNFIRGAIKLFGSQINVAHASRIMLSFCFMLSSNSHKFLYSALNKYLRQHRLACNAPCKLQTCDDGVWAACCDRHWIAMKPVNVPGIGGMGEDFQLVGGPHPVNLDISQNFKPRIRSQDERRISVCFQTTFGRATARRHCKQLMVAWLQRKLTIF